jgi:hypothetical protein
MKKLVGFKLMMIVIRYHLATVILDLLFKYIQD